MKILVPIDFSSYSDAAVSVAKQIIERRSGSLVLYHGLHYFIEEQHRNLSQSQEDAWRSNLEGRIILKRDTLSAQDISAEYVVLEGNFIDTLKEHCDDKRYDLVVMGSHGKSGLEKFMMGSMTSKAIRRLHQNVLVVKHDKPLDLSKVLFVSDLSIDDKEAFQYFLDFTSHWKPSEVHLLAVNTGGFFSQPSHLMLELLDEFAQCPTNSKIITHFESGATVDLGVRKFTNKHTVGLIGISNRSRSQVGRIFRGSNVEVLVSSSDVPVLTLDF